MKTFRNLIAISLACYLLDWSWIAEKVDQFATDHAYQLFIAALYAGEIDFEQVVEWMVIGGIVFAVLKLIPFINFEERQDYEKEIKIK